MRVDIRSEADFAKYKGKLKDKIVLPQAVRRVRMLDGPRRPAHGRAGRRRGADDADSGAAPAGGGGGGGGEAGLAEQIAQFYVAEGVAALLERGSDSDMSAGGSDLSWETQRVDGGTIFPGSGGSRDPKAPPQVPSATIAVEHYNRMVRMLEKGLPVRVELNIQTTFYPEAAGDAERHQHDRRDPGHRPRRRSRDHGRALRHDAGRHRRHRQRHRLGGDDGGGAGHQDASG